jgi:heterodisulfide reductase subunit C/nitrate reductase gamma subunit
MLQTALYTSLILSLMGFLYKIVYFIRNNRAFRIKKQALTRLNINILLYNTLVQSKLFKASKIRWLIHFLVASGFLYLVIIHALDDVTSFQWFNYYQSTVDPFQFLRNLAGFFVLAGCMGFLYRRLVFFKSLEKRNVQTKGLFSILLILMVILSGFLLEATKIISEPVFIEMVEEYSDIDEDTGLEDLKIYWENQYHVIFNEPGLITRDKLARGKELSEEYCMECHSDIKFAFISSTIARTLKKTGTWLNHHRADTFIYYAHYFLCLLILVSLPFSRFFHIFLIPIASLEKNLKKQELDPNKGYINTATLFACTNCGFCSDVCSVTPNFLITGNIDTLPHSKIESFKQVMINTPHDSGALYRLQSGNADCTYCHKCTDICPSGIDLQNLWCILKETLASKGYLDNYAFIDGKSLKDWADSEPEKILSTHEVTTQLADNVDAFENCIQCTICTNVCPIVEYDPDNNDYTPQQVMNLLRLGKKHLATGTWMVWNCLTCFSCQEHCPQGIRVTDIILELRNNGGIRAETMKCEQLTDKRTG